MEEGTTSPSHESQTREGETTGPTHETDTREEGITSPTQEADTREGGESEPTGNLSLSFEDLYKLQNLLWEDVPQFMKDAAAARLANKKDFTEDISRVEFTGPVSPEFAWIAKRNGPGEVRRFWLMPHLDPEKNTWKTLRKLFLQYELHGPATAMDRALAYDLTGVHYWLRSRLLADIVQHNFATTVRFQNRDELRLIPDETYPWIRLTELAAYVEKTLQLVLTRKDRLNPIYLKIPAAPQESHNVDKIKFVLDPDGLNFSWYTAVRFEKDCILTDPCRCQNELVLVTWLYRYPALEKHNRFRTLLANKIRCYLHFSKTDTNDADVWRFDAIRVSAKEIFQYLLEYPSDQTEPPW
jgi:hypothetical protein